MESVVPAAIEQLRRNLPPVFCRTELAKLTGGLCNGGTIANLQSQGVGPKGFFHGKKAAFERDTFLAWLAPRLSDSNAEALGLENEG